MPAKAWQDMSRDEKLDELHNLIQSFLSDYRKNVQVSEAKLIGLQKTVERLQQAVAALPTDSL
jgi:hypothetical protein